MKYRKRPIEIEAWQWNGKLLDRCGDLPQWLRDAKENCDLIQCIDLENIENFVIEIETLEGTHVARPGDYIIRGIQGELYPCKPDIFEQTYEEVEEENEELGEI